MKTSPLITAISEGFAYVRGPKTSGDPTYREKAVIITPFMFLYASVYLFLNHFPVEAPNLLPMLQIDQDIPFLVWTVYPYSVLLASGILLPLFIRSRELIYRTMSAYVVSLAINATIWALYPTTYPRPAAPVGGSLTEAYYLLMMQMDTPLNCLPSGHITSPAVMAWAVARENPRYAKAIWMSYAILAVSVLTTKQHYFWDIVAGMGCAALAVFLVNSYADRKEGLLSNRRADV